eukprot:SM000002S05747  [mRNA]  locus=s2:1890925:1891580:- [translate_table: standard]
MLTFAECKKGPRWPPAWCQSGRWMGARSRPSQSVPSAQDAVPRAARMLVTWSANADSPERRKEAAMVHTSFSRLQMAPGFSSKRLRIQPPSTAHTSAKPSCSLKLQAGRYTSGRSLHKDYQELLHEDYQEGQPAGEGEQRDGARVLMPRREELLEQADLPGVRVGCEAMDTFTRAAAVKMHSATSVMGQKQSFVPVQSAQSLYLSPRRMCTAK